MGCRSAQATSATQGYMVEDITDTPRSCGADVPAVEARRRFEGGSTRHVAAMTHLPGGRKMEVVPLRYLLPLGRSFMLDLFAGKGFASGLIRAQFGRTFLLEPHVAPDAGESLTARRQRAGVLAAVNSGGLPMDDPAVGLAGVHHVPSPGLAPVRDPVQKGSAL